jgi:hypothetical protein
VSYPQPSADDYAIRGYQYFRLSTLLTSPGDIYESAQSGHGVAIGPESDLANINVAYFDDQVSTFLQRTSISPARAFVGRIDARNDAVYTPANRAAKILIWAADIYDPNYRPIAKPAAFNGATDAINFVAPRLDVIEYFKPMGPVTPGRDDREFSFQNYPVVLGRYYLVLPYYGRKYAYIEITNREAIGATTFGVVGVNYAITQNDTTTPYHQETTLQAPTVIAGGGGQLTKIIRASTDGMFDALVLSLTSAGPAPLRVVMSDDLES